MQEVQAVACVKDWEPSPLAIPAGFLLQLSRLHRSSTVAQLWETDWLVKRDEERAIMRQIERNRSGLNDKINTIAVP